MTEEQEECLIERIADAVISRLEEKEKIDGLVRLVLAKLQRYMRQQVGNGRRVVPAAALSPVEPLRDPSGSASDDADFL